MWRRIATTVMSHPFLVLIPVMALLLLSASPLPSLHIVESDTQQLPAQSEARQGAEQVAQNFPNQSTTTFVTVIDFTKGRPIDAENVRTAFALASDL